MTWISPHSAKASEGHSRGKPDGSSVNPFSANRLGMRKLWLESWFRSRISFSILDLRLGLRAPNYSMLFYKMQCKFLSFYLKYWGPEGEVTTLFLPTWIKAKKQKAKQNNLPPPQTTTVWKEFLLSVSKVPVSPHIKSIYMP